MCQIWHKTIGKTHQTLSLPALTAITFIAPDVGIAGQAAGEVVDARRNNDRNIDLTIDLTNDRINDRINDRTNGLAPATCRLFTGWLCCGFL